MGHLTYIFVILTATCVISSPLDLNKDYHEMMFLSKYGYMDSFKKDQWESLTDDKMSAAIKQFQIFYDLNVTGQMDKETKKMMALPRCGMKDIMGTAGNRAKRYALQGSRWPTKALTYRIMRYPLDIERATVDKIIQDALNVWSKVVDLTFSPKSGQVNILISFASGEHGDGDPFDGPSGVLAHAYFPQYGGTTHFDNSEQWTLNENRGINLFQVAVHEFGHALGLSHSDVRKAVMFPSYMGYVENFELNEDDIDGITMIYSKKSTSDKPPIEGDGGTDQSGVKPCENLKIDTIFTGSEGQEAYIFSGENYWLIRRKTLLSGYPKVISNTWSGLPSNIDAAFTYRGRSTYFFKGSQCWRYKGQKLDSGFPKEISQGFPGIPSDVDAVIEWTGNGKVYFFKGSLFWKFDITKRPPVESTYPKNISNWRGLPNNLDAALHWKGYTFFFKDDIYYRFNDRAFAVDSASPSYPRSSKYWWFACPNAPKGTVGTASVVASSIDDYLYEESNDINPVAGYQNVAVKNNQTVQTDAINKNTNQNQKTTQSSTEPIIASLFSMLLAFIVLKL